MLYTGFGWFKGKGGGGGSSTFIGLTDVPASYVGGELKGLRVNAAGTALEFYTPADASVTLADTASNGLLTADQTFLGKSGQRVVFQQDISGAKEIWGYGASEMVFNDGGIDYDYRWESVGQANALFVQGSDGFVGMGIGAPTARLHVFGTGATNATQLALFENSAGTDIFRLRNDGFFSLGYEAGLGDVTNGVTNTYVGYKAGKMVSTATGVIAIGYLALGDEGGAAVTANDNIAIGREALRYSTTGGPNIAIGRDAMWGGGIGAQHCIAIGKEVLQSLGGATGNIAMGYANLNGITTGQKNLALGYYCGVGITTSASYNVFLGAYASGSSGARQSSIAIGYGAVTTANNQCVIGGDTANGADVGFITDVYFGRGVVSTTLLASLTIQPTGASGADVAAGKLIIAAPKATGNVTTGSDIEWHTPDAGASGSTLQSLTAKVTLRKDGRFYQAKGQKWNRTEVNDAAYVILATDFYIAMVSLSAGRTITVPDASTFEAGTAFIIKDADGLAATWNIVLDPAGTDTIDNAATYTMATNYQSVTLISDGISNWELN